jgi:hypothetical protein
MSATTDAPARRRTAGFLLAGLLISLLLAGVVSYWASSDPDGLNKVAIDHGFAGAEQPHPAADSPFAGYGTRGVDNEFASGALAGVVGVGITLVVAGGLFMAIRRRGDHSASGGD